MKRFAIASFAVGAVLAAFFVVLIVRSAPSSPQPVGGGLVHLSKEGMSIYASTPGVDAICEVKTAGDTDVPLEVPSGSESIGINGVNWYLVARSTEKVPPGDYVVSCIDDESGATYAVGPRISIITFVLSILGLVFSLLIFIGLGATLLAVGSHRRRKNTPGNTFPGNPPGYPQPGGPPGYPQPGNPQYGPPPGYPQPGGPPGSPPPGGPQYGPGSQGNSFPGYPPPGSYNPGPNPDRPQDRPQDD